ncbi:molybdopterin molybdotransferase MoeA [Joostella sp. CR20]|uniref:molybdopterin molybdotransferase MoeA n=1 Tax=Joostella sp. CR20 TaxID=2804312 RepID=UPI00313E5226
MIAFEEAYKKVLEHTLSFGNETVLFTKSLGRVLAEDIYADRDFPPFDRATKDGIAINSEGLSQTNSFKIEGIVSAGTPQAVLQEKSNCVEIMTGAVLPKNADTVVMYEEIVVENGIAKITNTAKKGQNIHYKGSDVKKGAVVVKKDTLITASEVGILAAVGKVEVLVKKLPKVTLISTGDELVAPHETPAPHQIRNSNMHSLHALLLNEQIHPQHVHLNDNLEEIESSLKDLLHTNDVLILSGGVSKGKFDFIPQAFENLEVEKVFHRVKQRPGKPFWFGVHHETKTTIFSFPGNPVSTFVSYHLYFKNWLQQSLNISAKKEHVKLGEAFSNTTSLTLFVRVKVENIDGELIAFPVKENGSGDLMSLAFTDGFVIIAPTKETFQKGETVPFIATR